MFMKDLLANLPSTWNSEVVDIVCLGIGSLSTSIISQHQFALLTHLKEGLFKVVDNVYLYDPVLSTTDYEIASRFGCARKEIQIGRYKIQKKTVFFMPHCPRALYNNVLLENWSGESLLDILIIGNSFSGYDLKQMSKNNAKNRISLVHRILPCVQEYPLSNDVNKYSEIFMAFHDTSIHSFHTESNNQIFMNGDFLREESNELITINNDIENEEKQ